MDFLEKVETLRNNSKKICFVDMKTGNISDKFQNRKSFRYKLFSEVCIPQRFSNCGASKLGSTISYATGILLTVLESLENPKPRFSLFVLPLSQATTEPPKKKPDPVTSETVVIWGLRLWQVIGIFAIFVLAVSKW